MRLYWVGFESAGVGLSRQRTYDVGRAAVVAVVVVVLAFGHDDDDDDDDGDDRNKNLAKVRRDVGGRDIFVRGGKKSRIESDSSRTRDYMSL